MTSGDESAATRLLARYRPPTHDELVDPTGRPHDATVALASTVDVLGLRGLLRRRHEADQVVEDDGVTYDQQQRWYLDPLPMILDHTTWTGLADGLVQRAELLDAVLADLYGPRNLLRRGVLPPEVVLTHPEFLRAADRIRLPSSRQLFMSATDLARVEDGRWLALSDRTQAPSGAGYAMENRRVVSRVMPGLHRGSQPERLRNFFHLMRTSLLEVAPRTAEAPRVVLLTPGSDSETAFDQAFLSTVLGYPLVNGGDLTVRRGRVFLQAMSGLEPVDVVLRRVDTMWADPLEGFSHSMLGVPGLLEAARLGNVSVVNPLGSGVLENNGMLAHLDALARTLLGEDLKLPSPQTFWCGDDASRRHVLANLDSLVIKPLSRWDKPFTVFGRELSTTEREELAARIEAQPNQWVGQEEVVPSTAPVVTPDGLNARHTVLRTFAVATGGRYELMAGGLARLSPADGRSQISNALGAMTKDVWVLPGVTPAIQPADADLADDDGAAPVRTTLRASEPALSSRTAEHLFWLGRYSERAEQTVRFLRVTDDLVEDHLHRRGTSGYAGTQAMLTALTQITMAWPGFVGEGAEERLAHPATELLSLSVDAERLGSVAHAIRRTTALAQSLREQLSMDTWVVLGSLERQLLELARLARDSEENQAGVPLQPRLTRVLEGLLALAGLQSESLVRDTGWHFLDAGRRVERALQILTLLRFTVTHRHRPGVESFVQEAVLIMAESVITHRRRYRGKVGTDESLAGLLELLLLDEDNPRSVAYQLSRLYEDLDRLPSTQPGAEEVATSVQNALARMREMSLGRDGLDASLDQVREELSHTAEQFERVHFIHQAPPRPMENQQARLGRGGAR